MPRSIASVTALRPPCDGQRDDHDDGGRIVPGNIAGNVAGNATGNGQHDGPCIGPHDVTTAIDTEQRA